MGIRPITVVHRIDDLEISRMHIPRSRHVVHRIDDLESNRNDLFRRFCVVHRIDNLEMFRVEVRVIAYVAHPPDDL